MSLGFVGRMYSSIKGFYNEINSATLTGAIDVVIVKQEDGSYHSSPFHVRFGKLGVLRAREKIVDIEINGQPVDLHMKLGEAGEAFFVQEVTDAEVEHDFPAYLATSPIHSSDELMLEGLAQLRAESERQEQLRQQQLLPPHIEEGGSLAINLASVVTKDGKSDSSREEEKVRHKGKPRRKVLKKKKQKYGATRSSPRSQSMPENLASLDQDHIFEMEVSGSTSEDEEVAAFSLGASRSTSLDMKHADLDPSTVDRELLLLSEELELPLREHRINSLESFLTPLSEPEMTPLQSPLPSRPETPKSDTEVDRQHTEEVQQQLLQETSATWDWGEFPKQPAMSTPDRQPSKERIDTFLERQDSEKVTSGGLLSLWSKQKKKAVKTTTTAAPPVEKKETVTVAEQKGMYLDDLATLEDPELAKLYLGSPRFQSIREGDREDDNESGRGASLPQSPHSVDGAIGGPVSFLQSEVRHLGIVSLSLCGGLSECEPLTLDKFMKKVITYDDLAEQPSILLNPDLVIKIRDGYFNWATAAPMVLCEMAFNKQLPDSTMKSLVKKNMPTKKVLKKKGSWWLWRSSTNQNAEDGTEDVQHPASTHMSPAINVTAVSLSSDNEAASSRVSESSLSPVVSPATSPPTSVHNTPRKFHHDRNQESEQQHLETDTDNSEKENLAARIAIPSSPSISPPSSPPALSSCLPTDTDTPLAHPSSPPALSSCLPTDTDTPLAHPSSHPDHPSSHPSDSTTHPTHSPPPPTHSSSSPFTSTLTVSTEDLLNDQPPSPTPSLSPSHLLDVDAGPSVGSEDVCIDLGKPMEKYIKALRLTSEQVEKLNLREGQNEISFSVTTQYQGTTRCMSHIYLWNYDDKIVISDIDGTITKSDVMGQILPLIGRDWSQSGVAQLFTRINNNGYKLLYLSARAIGQSRITKDLLRSIRQGDRVLPDGPLLLNPTSLISAFHREVVLKNPEEFKIHCLKDIAALFPNSPFYAGFGNKINDVIAYRALQIPSFRIFTINPQGQLRYEFSHTFLSSYSKMSDIADHFFPPISVDSRSMSNEFSSVNYWRTPPPIVDPLDLVTVTTLNETVTATMPITVATMTAAPTATATTTATVTLAVSPVVVEEEKEGAES
ncbi:phosphatidate phosphatase LPIN2-like [Littorina saxatilis]|uniref:phosphatidate phosphatase LPIN2-like n=1 Tax=Littorina saxatilis TaxID=31220 RepID=UPI0038B53A8A